MPFSNLVVVNQTKDWGGLVYRGNRAWGPDYQNLTTKVRFNILKSQVCLFRTGADLAEKPYHSASYTSKKQKKAPQMAGLLGLDRCFIIV